MDHVSAAAIGSKFASNRTYTSLRTSSSLKDESIPSPSLAWTSSEIRLVRSSDGSRAFRMASKTISSRALHTRAARMFPGSGKLRSSDDMGRKPRTRSRLNARTACAPMSCSPCLSRPKKMPKAILLATRCIS